nr:immunoglobulin heavy chain junction region [Mus musculus]
CARSDYSNYFAWFAYW